MIRSQIAIPTATPMVVWFFNTRSGVAEVRPSVPSAALAAEADALERPVTVVVLVSTILVVVDGPDPGPPAAELSNVEMGVEAELSNVDTGLGDWNPTPVDELPVDAAMDAAPTDRPLALAGFLRTSVDDDAPAGG